MSELKAFELKVGKNLETDSPLVVGVDNKLNARIMSGEEVYIKPEVDKVFAEMKKACNDKDDWCLHTLKENSHHKYKRCLTMARIAQDDWHLHNSFYAMGHQEFEKRKCKFYEKWRKRWLELAEKFKEAK